ncbi:hypothetical protein [Halovenus sp. HT40]|uniref:hypothetical protein n=1 Tax=Halovenus sp. HT40 TaxID=3126691 RepID=UPI00300E7732
MDVTRFISEALQDRADLNPERVRAIVRTAPTLTEARETLGDYIEQQAVADRIIQEIVLEDDTVDREEFAAQMPLVDPRNETKSMGDLYVEDLSVVGERRYVLRFPQDSETEIERQRMAFLGVADNGDVGTIWETVDTISFPEEDLEIIENIITMDDPLARFHEPRAD